MPRESATANGTATGSAVGTETSAAADLRLFLERRGRATPRQSAQEKSRQSDVFNARNQELFARRDELRAEIAPLEERPEDELSPTEARRLRRLRFRLNEVHEELVRVNWGIARVYAKKFISNASPDDTRDFEQAALAGLARGIATYDPARGRFAQWSLRAIKREVLDALRAADYPNMNRTDFEARTNVLDAVKRLQATHGDDYAYTFDEVAALSGSTVGQVQRVLQAPRLESLSNPVGDEANATLGDVIEDPDQGIEDSVMTRVSVAALENYGLPVLDDRELFVVVRRFGLDGEPRQRLAAIGEHLNLSREAVRQVEAKAMAKLGHPTVLYHLVRSSDA